MIYLDNSSTTRQYDEVTNHVLEIMNENFGNPSSLHRMGLKAERIVENARMRISHAVGCSKGELFFVGSGTESDNMGILGFAEANRKRGRKIITSSVEHPAVMQAYKFLETQGFQAVYIDVDRDGLVDLQKLRAEVDDETILISIMHVNNEVGTIQPIEEIGRMKKGAMFHSDMIQSYGKIPMDMTALGLDGASFSAHKIHGPKGIGGLYLKDGVRFRITSYGGGQEGGRRSGTENVPAIGGFSLATEMSQEKMMEAQEYVGSIKRELLSGLLDEIADIRVNSPENSIENILNVSFMGVKGEVILHMLESEGIYVGTGSACSSRDRGKKGSLAAMGRSEDEIQGAIRFSIGRMNSLDQVETVVYKVKKSVEMFRKMKNGR